MLLFFNKMNLTINITGIKTDAIKIKTPKGMNSKPSMFCTFHPFDEFVARTTPKHKAGIKKHPATKLIRYPVNFKKLFITITAKIKDSF